LHLRDDKMMKIGGVRRKKCLAVYAAHHHEGEVLASRTATCSPRHPPLAELRHLLKIVGFRMLGEHAQIEWPNSTHPQGAIAVVYQVVAGDRMDEHDQSISVQREPWNHIGKQGRLECQLTTPVGVWSDRFFVDAPHLQRKQGRSRFTERTRLLKGAGVEIHVGVVAVNDGGGMGLFGHEQDDVMVGCLEPLQFGAPPARLEALCLWRTCGDKRNGSTGVGLAYIACMQTPSPLSDPAETGHAVSRLRTARLAASSKPYVARGSGAGRCGGCRLIASHCICDLRPSVAQTRAGMCLIMGDIEALKPSNTGWLVADLVADTYAFGWSRTAVDPALLALLTDPQWQPYVVFPGEFVAQGRRVHERLPPPDETGGMTNAAPIKRPLFILLDGTWAEARKMFRKSPYLDALPVLSLHPEHVSNYRLRRSAHDHHFCTSEVAALCLQLAGEERTAQQLAAWLDVFGAHYLSARCSQPLDRDSPAHQRLRELAPVSGGSAS